MKIDPATFVFLVIFFFIATIVSLALWFPAPVDFNPNAIPYVSHGPSY